MNSFVLFVVLLLVADRVSGADYIQVHSVLPPMLQNYWENGMRFWSIGMNTVVTDNYVRLTGAMPNSKGYLWNRHPNQMEAFELNVTLQMRDRQTSQDTSDTRGAGVGVWYTTSKKLDASADTDLFGFSKRFSGVGVIVGHSNEISLVVNDNGTHLDADSIQSRRRGSCRVAELGELHITVTIRYDRGAINVLYAYHEEGEPRVEDYSRAVFCAGIDSIVLDGEYRFGVTALGTANSWAVHDIRSVIMTPLSNVSQHEKEEEEAVQFRLFENEEKNMTE